MLELASDSDPRRPVEIETFLTNLKRADSICGAAGTEDITSSFVGARFSTLDDSALKTSRHYHLHRVEIADYKGKVG
jgi:hypothetical protein